MSGGGGPLNKHAQGDDSGLNKGEVASRSQPLFEFPVPGGGAWYRPFISGCAGGGVVWGAVGGDEDEQWRPLALHSRITRAIGCMALNHEIPV